MNTKRKINYYVISIAIIILSIIGYYSYNKSQEAIYNGVYTIAYVKKLRPARNGWKIITKVHYKGKKYNYDGLIFWDYFSIKDTGGVFFAKILDYDPERGVFIIPTKKVPDSILTAPQDGWSEEWMKDHFPEVVQYVHRTN